jgi:hypothetical protein
MHMPPLMPGPLSCSIYRVAVLLGAPAVNALFEAVPRTVSWRPCSSDHGSVPLAQVLVCVDNNR